MTGPHKAGHPQTRGAKAAQNSLQQEISVQKVSYRKFLDKHLSALPQAAQIGSWDEEQQKLIKSISQVELGNEHQLYTGDEPLIKLCNSVSASVSKSLEIHDTVLRFHSHHGKSLSDPLESPLEPDIVIYYDKTNGPEGTQRQKSTKRFTWFNIAAVGEAKVRDPKQARHKTAHYLRIHLQFRPELHSVIGFSADTNGYSLYYHDASVIHVCTVKWENSLPLHAFVGQLYQGVPSDPSIVNLRPEESDPSWLVKIGDDVFLIISAIPSPGLSQHRFTAMAIDIKTGNRMRLFMKDYYPDTLRRFDEGLLYAKAHKGKMVPGMMRADYHGHPLDIGGNKLTTANSGKGAKGKRATRWKKRVVTRDVGEPLSDCSSLLEFLKVMYDACVVQRHLHRKKVLHRDISENNIMMAPTDDGRYYEACKLGFNEIKYLNQVLNPAETPKPACLVIDLGHGADLDELKTEAEESEVLAEITGTPKFTSLSVSKGGLLEYRGYKPDEEKIPKLEGQALKLYTSCFAEYDAYTQAVDQGDKPSSGPKFMHQLFHDAESTFWVIAWFLTRSAPKDEVEESNEKANKPDTEAGEESGKESDQESDEPDEETDEEADEETNKPNPILAGFVWAMKSHVPGQHADARQSLTTELETWRQILHPGLVDVAPMLSDMHQYIRPEWGYRQDLTEKHPEHAHEALMRLLLRLIVEIVDGKTKDVKFAPAGTRVLPDLELPPKSRSTTITTTFTARPASGSTNTKKRSRPPEDDGAESKEPRPNKRRQVGSAGDRDEATLDKLIAEAKVHSWPVITKNYKLDSGSHRIRSTATSPPPPLAVQV